MDVLGHTCLCTCLGGGGGGGGYVQHLMTPTTMTKIQLTLLQLTFYGSYVYISQRILLLACSNGIKAGLEYMPVLNISLNSNSAYTKISTAFISDDMVQQKQLMLLITNCDTYVRTPHFVIVN